jgi:hypothetical protein
MHDIIPAAPIILVTTAHPSLHHHTGPNGESVHPRLGRLLQPRHTSSVELTARAGIPWACDNDAFNGWDAAAERRYVNMIDRVAGLPGCLFVTVPDVVADAAATRAMFDHWAPELERRELPLAIVAQDGMTVDELRELAPRLAALFVGGSTEWKLGDEAAELAREAKTLGLFVHWGRVNTRRRFDHIVATGAADSFDGSKWARFRNTYLDAGLVWLDDAAAARRAALAGHTQPNTRSHPVMTENTAATPAVDAPVVETPVVETTPAVDPATLVAEVATATELEGVSVEARQGGKRHVVLLTDDHSTRVLAYVDPLKRGTGFRVEVANYGAYKTSTVKTVAAAAKLVAASERIVPKISAALEAKLIAEKAKVNALLDELVGTCTTLLLETPVVDEPEVELAPPADLVAMVSGPFNAS